MGINDIIEYIGQGDWTSSADGGFVIVYQPSTTDPSGKILTQSRGYAFPASALGGGGLPYKVYTALLTQTGTDAPVATVLENTLGGTVVWTYLGVGQYLATLSGAFTLNKTVIFAGITFNLPQGDQLISLVDSTQLTANSFFLGTCQTSGGYTDNLLANTAIEIRVYP